MPHENQGISVVARDIRPSSGDDPKVLCTCMCKRCRAAPRTLMTSPVPDYPWQVVGSDLFELKGTHYLLVVDYLSRYPEVAKLPSTTSTAVISAIKSIFSRHGIPEVVRSDNGPQYSSREFDEFAESYGFVHNTSSPHFPQSNGLAERMVKTMKQLISQSLDPYLALLNYRATPLPWCGISPAELIKGRRLRSRLPQAKVQLIPEWSYLPAVQDAHKHFKQKQKQKRSYDKCHRVRELSEIPDKSDVWVTSGDTPIRGMVQRQASSACSYIVDTPTGTICQNCLHLAVVPEEPSASTENPSMTARTPDEPPTPRKIMTRTQTGTEINPPSNSKIVQSNRPCLEGEM